MRTEFVIDKATPSQLAGWREGDGPQVLVLHGGPGLSFDYLDPMIEDIGGGYEIATYQQRGLAPSTTSCPVDIAQEVDDVCRVLDHLGWSRAWVVGHSWGGHLLLHLAVARQDRLLGGLAVDPLGGVGDGGLAAFGAEMRNRASEGNLAQADELERAMGDGEPTDEGMHEHLGLMWPGYFADPAAAPPMPPIGVSAAAYGTLFASIEAERARLEASLGEITVPMGFLAGSRSPIPFAVATEATAERIRGAWVEVAEGAGHFPWHECPGSVRRALGRLTRGGADR